MPLFRLHVTLSTYSSPHLTLNSERGTLPHNLYQTITPVTGFVILRKGNVW